MLAFVVQNFGLLLRESKPEQDRPGTHQNLYPEPELHKNKTTLFLWIDGNSILDYVKRVLKLKLEKEAHFELRAVSTAL
jgi:hypothetical protein